MAPMWHDHDLAARARTSRRRRLLGEGATCRGCNESDPLVLMREATGEVLCFRCRALREAPTKDDIWQFSINTCTTCGYRAPLDRHGEKLFERHHTAGRANLPGHTTLLCLNCHAKVSAAQRALGVDLRPQPDQRNRFVQSLNSVLCEVRVGVGCVSESMPTTWWQGFKHFSPTLFDAATAMLQVKWFAPEEGPVWTY